MSLLPKLDGASRVRWLFVTSLALNVFFVGAAGAVAFRYSGAGTVPLSNVAQINRDVANRLNRDRRVAAGGRRRGDAGRAARQCRKGGERAGRSAPVARRIARQPAGGAVRCHRVARRHDGEPRGAGKFRAGSQRRARDCRRQDVGGRPQQARGLVDARAAAPRRSRSTAVTPRCAAHWRRSPAARARRWCRPDRHCAAIAAPRRQARPWRREVLPRSRAAAPPRSRPCGEN